MRWRIKLEEYDFVVIHKSGKLNTNADALSRLDVAPINMLTRSKSVAITDATEENSAFVEEHVEGVIESETKSKNSENPAVRSIINLAEKNEINQILEEYHKNPMGGHQGVKRTVKRIRQKFKWPKMFKDIQSYISKCEICQKNKKNSSNKLPMKITTTSKVPFEKVSLDIVGPIPVSESGNNYILTFQDDLTKFILAIPIENQEAATIAEIFVRRIICIFGLPRYILTDQGTNFLSEMFKKMCQLLKIKKIQTTAWHPQSNGGLERSHRVLGDYLRSYANKDPTNWDSWVDYAVFCYNTTPHTATQYSPYEILFGFKPEIPSSLTKSVDPVYNYDDYVIELKARLQTGYQVIRENLIKAKMKSKTYYDKNSKIAAYNVGDKILLESKMRKNKKLTPIFLGPYEVVEINSPETSTIKIGNKKKVVHNNLIKTFIS